MDTIFNKAIILHKEGKLAEAERLYQKILKDEPTQLDVNNNLGVLLHSLGRFDEAEICFKKIIELKPNDTKAYYNLGVTFQNQKKFKEAELCFKKIIELKAEYVEAHNNLGVTFQNQEKFKEAELCFKKTIKLKPDYIEAHYNLGVTFQNQEKFKEAELCFKKTIELKPDYIEAHYNLGVTFQNQEKFKETELFYKKTIELKPDYIEAHYNLGVIFQKQEKFKEAEACYKKTIELKPDYAEAHNNLGVTFQKQEKFKEAEACYKKTIELKPDYELAHSNLGLILHNRGDLVAAIDSFKQALNIQPDFVNAWNNVFFPLQAMKLQTSSIDDQLSLLDEKITSKYVQAAESILGYRLNQGSLSSENSLNEVISIMSSNDNTFIKNPKVPTSKLTKPILPKKITAMKCTGRTGTGLLHSLIDGHPEVSTLPSIYFSEFFDYSTWEKIIEGGWQEMVDRFVTTYDVLFDTLSTVPIASKNEQFIINIARKEGMINLGKEKNEILSVDKKIFIKELKQLMNCYDCLDQFTFFKLVHSAYDKAIADHNKKNLIFYHIHDPDVYAQLNFLRLAPNTNWLIMVREPIQNCESWITKNFNDNSYRNITSKIFQMLFEVNHVIFQNDNSIGVRLEDLKKYPKKTMQALCNWLGIKEEDSLYQMTAQGKKWWGDPTSPDYKKEGMNPFGKVSINRKLGSVFSENDQFILRTLFYPFSVRFGYAEENLKKFKEDLKVIRPMLNEMFDFEKKLVQHTKTSTEKFMKSGPYLYLRSGMIECWNTLNKFHTYHNMLTPLKID